MNTPMTRQDTRLSGGHRTKPIHRFAKALAASLAGLAMAGLPQIQAAPAPPHGVVAASIHVVQHDFENNPTSVTVTTPYRIGDYRIRETANRGDYDLQIGEDMTDDADNGIVMTCVAQNGRDSVDDWGNVHVEFPGTNYCTTAIQSQSAGSYYIPIFQAPSGSEFNINVAAAYFPYATWLAGYAQNSANGGALETFRGSPGLVLGTHFIDLGAGKSTVDLTSLGIDSQTDGVLLVTGGKNEDNYSLSMAETNGTWTIFNKDNGSNGSSTEQDPVAFVFIPKTNTMVISGKFLGDGTIAMFSGDSPQFAVTNTDVGTYRLTIPGHSSRDGVLIISAEGGNNLNVDNIVSYQPNGDGWDIESRDLPGNPPGLQTVGADEAVVSFAFILGPTPGFAVTPTENLFTTENGDTAEFTVALDLPPTADVTINLASDNPAEGIATPASLTFTPGDWDVPQTVTITGQDDGDTIDGAVAYHIVLSPATSTDPDYNGVDPDDVTVLNADNDSGGITVNPTEGLATTEAGDTATFTVRLNTQPTADVTIGLTSNNTGEGTVSPVSLTFTSGDWDQEQTVTVTGVDDPVDDGDIEFKIVTAPASSADPLYNAQNASDVLVTNQDNDTAGITLAPGGALTVVEGGTTALNVSLASQPLADVTVTLTSGNTAEGTVAPATLTFTPANWNAPQVATLTGADDLVADGDAAFVVTNTVSSSDPLYAAIPAAEIPATTLDNEALLALPSGQAVYGIGMPGVGIDGRATIADPHTANYDTGTLTVAVTVGDPSSDLLGIRNTGTSTNEIGVSGNTVSYEGTAIGTFAGGSAGAPLVVTLNSAATPPATEALLRSVTFRNSSSDPWRALRTVAVTLTDADGGTSSANTTIRVGLVRLSDFQEGADGGYGAYQGAADVELVENQPDTVFPTGHSAAEIIWMDYDTTGANDHALLRFDNIVGDGPGQIPSNSIIVYAELILDMDPSRSSAVQGDGSPLYRMLVDWYPEYTTWNSIGAGIILAWSARDTYDSQLGVEAGSANTGTGKIALGVTPDVQAWVNGTDANYGWGMPGWPGNTDGTGFSPCESADIDSRPRLRVMWVPAGTSAASFRQGVDGYAGAFDTRLRESEPDTDFSLITGFFSDWAVTNAAWGDNEQVLIRFDDVIGPNVGQVPPNSRIEAAMLDLASTISNAMGDGGQFHPMLQPWWDTNTWNSMLNGITADGVEAATGPTAVAGNASRDPNVQGAFLSFELTADIQAWSDGLRPNYGWAILPWPDGGDGWGFASSESVVERERPQLRVFYGPASTSGDITLQPLGVSEGGVQINFSATADRTYTIQRVGMLGADWASIGAATTDAGGQGTFADTSPLPGSAFYRVVHP